VQVILSVWVLQKAILVELKLLIYARFCPIFCHDVVPVLPYVHVETLLFEYNNLLLESAKKRLCPKLQENKYQKKQVL
jgi:hypothetical protein